MPKLTTPLIRHPAILAIPTSADPMEICKVASLNWYVHSAPVTYPAPHLPSPIMYAMRGTQVLFRTDTGEPLSVTPANFVPDQPYEHVDYYLRFAEFFEAELVSVGALQRGKLFWGLLRTKYSRALPHQHGTASSHLLLTTRCDSAYAASVAGLCVLDSYNASVPATFSPHPPFYIPRSPEFLTPSALADVWQCIAETTGFLDGLVYVSGALFTWEHMTAHLSETYKGTRPQRARNLVAAIRNATYERHQRAPGIPLTPLDLIAQVAQATDRFLPGQNPHSHLLRTWMGVGAETKQTAVSLAFSHLR
jgi:hypothetical protein